MAQFGPVSFDANIVHLNGQVVVEATGELDLSTVDRLSATLKEATALHVPVVLDLSKVTFIDSSGLAAIVGAHNALVESNGTLLVRSPRRLALVIFHATGLDTFLTIEDASDN